MPKVNQFIPEFAKNNIAAGKYDALLVEKQALEETISSLEQDVKELQGKISDDNSLVPLVQMRRKASAGQVKTLIDWEIVEMQASCNVAPFKHACEGLSLIQSVIRLIEMTSTAQDAKLPPKNKRLSVMSSDVSCISAPLMSEPSRLSIALLLTSSTETQTPEIKDELVGLGDGPDIPQCLRHIGPIPNRHFSLQDCHILIQDTMRAKQGHPQDLQSFFYIYLKKRYGSMPKITEFAYNLKYAAAQYKNDAICRQFTMTFNGNLYP